MPATNSLAFIVMFPTPRWLIVIVFKSVPVMLQICNYAPCTVSGISNLTVVCTLKGLGLFW